LAKTKQNKEEQVEKLKVRITGAAPLLMHSIASQDIANPTAKTFKALSKKRNKTDSDLLELRRLEWAMGLYTKGGKVIIPGEVIEATMKEAGKKFKLGKEVSKAIRCVDDPELQYPDKKLSLSDLYEKDGYAFSTSVRVEKSRVNRTRPRFDDWSITTEILYDESRLDRGQVVDILNEAGSYVGFCDWRPRFGRFSVEVMK
jgi:hypothetical protein